MRMERLRSVPPFAYYLLHFSDSRTVRCLRHHSPGRHLAAQFLSCC